MSLLWQSMPALAAEVEVENPLSAENTQEAMRDLTKAPAPFGEVGVVASSSDPQAINTANEECFWASGGNNPLDEQAFPPNNGNWTIKIDHTDTEIGPFSGIADYRASNPGGGVNPLQARIDASGTVADVDNIVHTYVYGAFRVVQSSQSPPTPDRLYFRVKVDGVQVVNITEIASSDIADNYWHTWSYTLPGSASDYRNRAVTLEVFSETGYYGHPSTQFVVDYSGVAYCTSLPDINTVSPVILDPASINTLYNGLLIRDDTTLWIHVSSGSLAYSDRFKSVERLYEQDEFYKAVFRMKPPFDRKFEYLRLANKLWFSQAPEQSEAQIRNIINQRLPTESNLQAAIDYWRSLAERQEAAGNAAEHADASRWMQAEMGRRLNDIRSMTELQRRVAGTPVTYIVEASYSEMSTLSYTRQGWAGAYVLSGEKGFEGIRGMEVPEGTADDVITDIWRNLVEKGAPRAMKIIRGNEQVRISFWQQFKAGLKYTLPALISQAYDDAVSSMYLYRAYALAAAEKGGEYVPWVAGAAATLALGDAAWDLYTYEGLGANETTQTLSEYLTTQNVFYRLLVFGGLVEYQEQTIGSNWSNVQFCFPQHELWFHRYPDYRLQTMVIPEVCGSGSYMEWRIKEADGDRLTIEKNTGSGGPVIELDLSKNIGNAKYTIYLNDYRVGLIAQTFIIQLIRYDSASGEGVFNIYWLSTETPEQQGLCAGASPTRPDDRPCAVPPSTSSGNLYLPFVRN